MGLIMSPGSVSAQLDAMNRNLNSSLAYVQNILAKIGAFEGTIDVLKGVSYSAVRNYYSRIHLPLLRGLAMYLEDMIQENYQYKMYIGAYLSGIGYVDEDALKHELTKLREQINGVYGMMCKEGYPTSLSGMLNCMEQTERLIVDKLEQISQFRAASASLYANMNMYKDNILSGIQCLNGSTLEGKRICYKADPVNTEWASNLNWQWVQNLEEQKVKFVSAMSEHFGFDQEVSNLLYELYFRMDEAGVENVNQKYFAILGSYVYSNEDGFDVKNVAWNKIAGTHNDVDAVLAEYGFTKEEREKLKKEIKNNYGLSWIDDPEDNIYYGKSDLAHMSVILATMLNDYEAGWEYGGSFVGGCFNGVFNLEANAGYIGDLYGTATNGAKLTQDDYKADLDAVNLCNRLKTNQNGIGVVGDYYAGISEGRINRANEFFVNLGDGDYNQGVQILEQQIQSNREYLLNNPTGYLPYIGGRAWVNAIKQKNVTLHDVLLERHKIERNFYRSIMSGANEYQEIEEINVNLAEKGTRKEDAE